MKILVTGGAGYIGSFMVCLLIDRGYDVTVFDNLKRGHKEAIDSRAEFIEGDITSVSDVESLFTRKIDAIIHFAGLISVEESTREPQLYEENNVTGSKTLFTAAIKNGVRKIIFSSTAAVYGNPNEVPIPEDHPKNPTSPYGESKLKIEEVLSDLKKENPDLSYAALRYFNASGAALDGSSGEGHEPETHIIPLAIRAAMNGSSFNLYGTDYQTPDGTCIRDYIHVLDLVEAHLLALEKMDQQNGEFIFNVGTGKGYSNREIVSMIENVSGKKIEIIEQARRSGDPEQLIADASKIGSGLGFSPKHSDLKTIVESAWMWHSKKS